VFEAKVWIYRSLYVVVWFSMLAFCLAQVSFSLMNMIDFVFPGISCGEQMS
jgi:hypothetical protein